MELKPAQCQPIGTTSPDVEAAVPPLPYENQMLGAFIYALGRECGPTDPALPVNLFQQTPLDQRFGDLVVGAQWCVAIEFKRTRKGLAGEFRKWSDALKQHPQIIHRWAHIADRGHWVCYGQPHPEGVELRAEPYRTLLGVQPTAPAVDASELIRALAHNQIGQNHPRYGVPAGALAGYLHALASLRLTGGGSTREATWLCAFGGEGNYRFVCATTLPELLDRLPPTPEREAEREWARAEHEREREQEPGQER
ncbi:hypothetical protein E5C33_10860 [Stenotrophomonas maltophilia]|uniref:hypothetical protein n=1 Tax=Stenotrophomonas maltophilia TaxID=40324 RepID=UPI0010769136|nr:hypothetical protein [Stenotrophomonas maltophilia]TFZ45281.1 hypothetical protein E5C33_10860 [Stenotrophomonas maltophilia]